WKWQRMMKGYRMIHVPWHPFAVRGYVLEHRLVMEAHLGRFLTRSEVVHHKNKKPLDNALSNLELFQSNADHLRHELTGHVPQWTPEGKARIQAALRQRKGCRCIHKTRQLALPDAQPSL